MTGPELGEDLLSAYLDDELDAPTRTAVADHLAESTEWREILDEVRGTRDALRGLPSVDGSSKFWARVMAGDAVIDLAAERRRRRLPRWGMAVAAAAAVVVIGVVMVPQEQRVRPAVATFANEHAARSSVANDVISNLASVGVPTRPAR